MKYRRLENECSKYKRCFIIGTGPSLTKNDLRKIKNECTFVSNRFLYYGDEFSPTVYFCQDSTVMLGLLDEINSYSSSKFKMLNSYILRINNEIKVDRKTIFYNVNRKRYIKGIEPEFSMKKLDYYDGYTVTYSMIQAAASLGFREIYLLGIDFNYKLNNKGEIDNKASYSTELSGRFTSTGSVNMDYNLSAYQRARAFCEANKISIYNATRGGKLEVFKRVDLDKVLETKTII